MVGGRDLEGEGQARLGWQPTHRCGNPKRLPRPACPEICPALSFWDRLEILPRGPGWPCWALVSGSSPAFATDRPREPPHFEGKEGDLHKPRRGLGSIPSSSLSGNYSSKEKPWGGQQATESATLTGAKGFTKLGVP